jgi:hypothetical protein
MPPSLRPNDACLIGWGDPVVDTAALSPAPVVLRGYARIAPQTQSVGRQSCFAACLLPFVIGRRNENLAATLTAAEFANVAAAR